MAALNVGYCVCTLCVCTEQEPDGDGGTAVVALWEIPSHQDVEH